VDALMIITVNPATAGPVFEPRRYRRGDVFAGYGDYRAKTASIGRQIPIFRLKPR
jgi:hypothetical protein